MKNKLYMNGDGAWCYEIIKFKSFFREEKIIYVFIKYEDYLKFKPFISE